MVEQCRGQAQVYPPKNKIRTSLSARALSLALLTCIRTPQAQGQAYGMGGSDLMTAATAGAGGKGGAAGYTSHSPAALHLSSSLHRCRVCKHSLTHKDTHTHTHTHYAHILSLYLSLSLSLSLSYAHLHIRVSRRRYKGT